MKTIFGLFLIVHGLIHLSFVSPQPAQKAGAPAWPFDITKSTILNSMGLSVEVIKSIGISLAYVATIGFILSGLGWLGIPLLKTYWVAITVFSSVSSLLLIAFFWNNWFVMGPLIDLVILYLIYAKEWRV